VVDGNVDKVCRKMSFQIVSEIIISWRILISILNPFQTVGAK